MHDLVATCPMEGGTPLHSGAAPRPGLAAISAVRVRAMGRMPYIDAWRCMREFTASRRPGQADELWWLEHPPVYTLGLSSIRADLLDPGDTEVVASDRGGRAAYHGPGQLVVYPLIDLRAAGIGARAYVRLLEDAILAMLSRLGVAGVRRQGAPGVYTANGKIAFVGVRISRHCTYHGLALNVYADPEPYARIHPCGMPGLAIDSLAAWGHRMPLAEAAARLIPELLCRLAPTGIP